MVNWRSVGVMVNPATGAGNKLETTWRWNPAVEDQASDRAHRIGQLRLVPIYRFVAEDTIEEKIVKLHADKRELADSLLDGTEMSWKLNAEELLALIKG